MEITDLAVENPAVLNPCYIDHLNDLGETLLIPAIFPRMAAGAVASIDTLNRSD
jgi:hypothetical protein